MTQTDAYHEAHLPMARDLLDRLGPAVLAGGFEQLDALVGGMGEEELTDSLVAMAQRTRVDSLISGRVAHEIRLRTPDGEWGRRVRELASLCEVSDRTIHRWMSSYQERAGLELTPAQANARAAADRASAAAEAFGSDPDEWELDDDEDAGLPGMWESDGVDNAARMRALVGEPDNPAPAAPSTAYENPPERPAPRRAVIPPDETWVGFAVAQIAAQNDGYGPQALEKMAKARWDRQAQESPMDLLEDLEQIHGAGRVDDALMTALLEAEERKALKPEVVAPGGEKEKKPKRAGGGGAGAGKVAKLPDPQAGFMNVEKGMEYTRELHSHVAGLLDEGGPELLVRIYGNAENNLASWMHTLDGVLKKVRRAREEVKRGPAAPSAAPGEPEF